ncbi:hypothetical protein DV735_g3830, partial [Chaetothyriales sp. CBS 134920]
MDSPATKKRRDQKAQFFQDLDKLDQYLHDDSDGSIHAREEQQPSPPLRGSFTPRKPSTEVPPQGRRIFSGLTFFFIPNQSRDRIRKVRIEKAVALGAKWTQIFDHHTSHIIVDDKLDIKEALKDVGNAANVSKTPMVRMRWLVDCFRDQTLHDPRRSVFRVRGMKDPFCTIESEEVKDASPTPNDVESASATCPLNGPELESKGTEDDFAQAMELVQKVGLLDYQSFVDVESVAEGAQPEHRGEKAEGTGCFASRLPDFLCKQKNDGSSTNPNLQTMYILQQLANHYERVGDKWRNLSYRKAIAALRHQQRAVRTKEDALSIRGIGKSIAEKIEEISTTGHLRKLEMAEADPQERRLMIFMGIYGVGLKQARMWLNQGYRTLEDLLQNAELTPSQKIGTEHYEDFQARIPREEVRKHAALVEEVLSSIDSELQVIISGSYRRGKPDCGDIDLLITKQDASLGHIRTLMTQYAIPELKKRGFLKAELSSSHSDDSGSKWHGASALPGASLWRRLDMLYMPWDERGAAMIYFTGNDIFNRSMRLLASWKGMRLNQHGLYKDVMREASRRVGGTASTTINPAKEAGGFVSFDSHLDPGLPLDPTLDMDSFTHSYLHDEDGLHTTINNLEAAHRPELTSIAASATEMLPSGGVQTSDLEHSTVGEEMDMLSADKTKRQAISLDGQPGPGMPPPLLKEARFVAEPGTSFKAVKPKVRGKFGPVRRQEVQTPRIWKTPCVRTKLVNEFSLFAAGLCNTTTFRELTQLRLQAMSQENTGLVEFNHLDGSSTGLSFQGTRLGVMEDDHGMQADGDGAASEKRSRLDCVIINSDTEEISRAMGAYVQKFQHIQTLVMNESGCLRASIRTLAAIAEEKNDGLLSRILLLWTSTLLVVDRSHLLWEAVLLESDQMEHTRGEAWSSLPTPPKVSTFSNRMMNDQLRAGVETQAQRLNKVILAELERRLVQKQRDGHFEIFIGLVVLLNCFERMCWAFKAQESEQPPNRWPFPQRRADDFACEGERFADIIEVLADMRGLIPKTRFDPAQNTLVPLARSDSDDTTTRNSTAEEHLVLDWFQEAAITKEYLRNNSNSSNSSEAKPFDPTDLRSMDGRFFARLLVPDGFHTLVGGNQPH